MDSPQVLADLRVLELGDYISAAYCARLLADYGAQVVKVEPPGAGDTARRHGPFPNNEPDPESSGLFLALNTNKLGVTLDVATPTGAGLLRDLVRHVDVLVENNHPDDLERWGLTYQRLKEINPALVMTSITVFGHEGPYGRHKGYALTASAAGGAAHRIGDPKRYPIAMPYDRADYWGGMNGAPATMLALAARRRTGRGQHVDISTTECINTFGNGNDMIAYADTGFVTRRRGIHVENMAYPYTILPCKDGYFGLILGYQRHWDRLVDLIGNPPWSREPRYRDRAAMGFQYPEEVDELMKPWLAQHTKQELWAMCRERGIPYHAVQTVDEVLHWEQLQVRDYWRQAHDGQGRSWTLPGAPFKMSRTPARAKGPAPRLGQHNKQVYGGMLGLSDADLVHLRRTGVI